MEIRKIMEEQDHIIAVYIRYDRVFMYEWIGGTDRDVGYVVMRIRYNKADANTIKFHFKGRTDANKGV